MENLLRVFKPGDESRYMIYAEGKFGRSSAKTAHMILRYIPDRVACVVDSTCPRDKVSEVLPSVKNDVPIVHSVNEGVKQNPDYLVIGIAPTGGQLPETWREPILEAITHGIDVVSGLHTFLNEDEALVDQARTNGVALVDLRSPPVMKEISQGLWREREVPVVMTIGPDSAIGKLTAAWELKCHLEKQGHTVGFVATGQTGILLHGQGIVIDAAVRGDFMSSAVERLIRLESEAEPDVLVVEGQGSIYHEGYSGVMLGIIHGAMPDAFLFSHQPSKRANIYSFTFPPYRQMINDYESLVEWFKPVYTVGIQLNTSEYGRELAQSLCEEIQSISGLPTCDFVRFPESTAIEMMIKKLHLS